MSPCLKFLMLMGIILFSQKGLCIGRSSSRSEFLTKYCTINTSSKKFNFRILYSVYKYVFNMTAPQNCCSLYKWPGNYRNCNCIHCVTYHFGIKFMQDRISFVPLSYMPRYGGYSSSPVIIVLRWSACNNPQHYSSKNIVTIIGRTWVALMSVTPSSEQKPSLTAAPSYTSLRYREFQQKLLPSPLRSECCWLVSSCIHKNLFFVRLRKSSKPRCCQNTNLFTFVTPANMTWRRQDLNERNQLLEY